MRVLLKISLIPLKSLYICFSNHKQVNDVEVMLATIYEGRFLCYLNNLRGASLLVYITHMMMRCDVVLNFQGIKFTSKSFSFFCQIMLFVLRLHHQQEHQMARIYRFLKVDMILFAKLKQNFRFLGWFSNKIVRNLTRDRHKHTLFLSRWWKIVLFR